LVSNHYSAIELVYVVLCSKAYSIVQQRLRPALELAPSPAAEVGMYCLFRVGYHFNYICRT